MESEASAAAPNALLPVPLVLGRALSPKAVLVKSHIVVHAACAARGSAHQASAARINVEHKRRESFDC